MGNFREERKEREKKTERERCEKERNDRERQRREKEEREKKQQVQAVQQHFEESLRLANVKMPGNMPNMAYLSSRFYPQSQISHANSKSMHMSQYDNQHNMMNHNNTNNSKNSNLLIDSSSKKPNTSPLTRVDISHGHAKLDLNQCQRTSSASPSSSSSSSVSSSLTATGLLPYNNISNYQQTSSSHGYARQHQLSKDSSSPPHQHSNSTLNW